MRTTTLVGCVFLAVMLALSSVMASTTAFTYQGRLTDGGIPASGRFDFRFALLDAATNGTVIGGPQTNSTVEVADGLFTTSIDFGGAPFLGSDPWLEIGVRPAGAGEFTTLSPCQRVTPTPLALGVGNISNMLAALAGSNLTDDIKTNLALLLSVCALNCQAADQALCGTNLWTGDNTFAKPISVAGVMSMTPSNSMSVFGRVDSSQDPAWGGVWCRQAPVFVPPQPGLGKEIMEPCVVRVNATNWLLYCTSAIGWSSNGLAFTLVKKTGFSAPAVAIDGDGTFHLITRPTLSGGFDRWTSKDGTNWTLATANIIRPGNKKNDWDTVLANRWLWIEGGNYYLAYGATTNYPYGTGFCIGLATSSDGVTWTKYAGNPVISDQGVDHPCILKSGSTYYLWCHDLQACNGYRYTSTDLHTWTRSPAGPIWYPQGGLEGAAWAWGGYLGQAGDRCIVDAGDGRMFSYFTFNNDRYTTNGIQQWGGIGLAIFNGSLAQLVAGPEDSQPAIGFNPTVSGQRIGIFKSNPQYTLDVDGDINADGNLNAVSNANISGNLTVGGWMSTYGLTNKTGPFQTAGSAYSALGYFNFTAGHSWFGGVTTAGTATTWTNAGGGLTAGVDGSTGGAKLTGGDPYGGLLCSTGTNALFLGVNSTATVKLSNGGGIAFKGPMTITNVPVYRNNTAAKAGGLPAGALYRTGGDPDQLCIVH